MQNLKFVSIHAPCLDIKWGDNPESEKALQTIEKIYKKINARNVVFHEKEGSDFSVAKKYNFSASIENDDRRCKLNSPAKIAKALKKYPNMKFTFDFAHVLTITNNNPLEYVNLFKNKIVEVHLSWLGKIIADHRFLHKHDSKRIRKLLKAIKNLKVPLVLESVVNDEKQANLIQKEINYLRNL